MSDRLSAPMTRRQALAMLAPALGAMTLRGQAGGSSPAPSDPGSGDLAARLRRCTREEAPDLAARAIKRGAGPREILEAVFLGGVSDIRPRHVGGKLHAVLMVESVFQLAAAVSHRDAILLALWNLDEFKRSQQRDRDEGDWTLPPRPDVSFASESAARRAFLAAMDSWDDERADRALVGLLPFHDLESIFEILWPLAARSYVNIGHKIIFASQAHRTLGRLGSTAVEPALRSLVYGLLYRPGDRGTEAFDRSRGLGPSLPAGWLRGAEGPARSAGLLAAIRTAAPAEAQSTVAAAFKEGIGPGAVWDALRLLAAEIFARRLRSAPADDRAALLPVHAVTVVNALGHAWRTAREEPARRLLVLQAAGWLPALRDDLRRIVGLRDDRSPIDRPDTPGGPAGQDASIAGLVRRGIEPHQFKLAAALFEESRKVDPAWSAAIRASAVDYLPPPDGPDGEICRRSLDALRRAGV